MFDHVAMHICDPHGSIGTCVGAGGTEPVISGAQEFGFAFVFCAVALASNVIDRRKDFAVNQIVNGFADKSIAKIG